MSALFPALSNGHGLLKEPTWHLCQIVREQHPKLFYQSLKDDKTILSFGRWCRKKGGRVSSSCSSCNKRSWSCRVLPQSHYTPYTVSKMVACKYSSLSVLLTATGKDSHSHRTDVCNLAPTIPYWSCRFVWNLANEHQLVNVVINIFCYCFQMKDKRTQRSNINVMSLLKNNHQQCSTFRKKILGPAGPQVFIFCRQNKYSGRQKLYYWI